MITTRTAALVAAMSLLGTVVPAAFAQNTSINTDDDSTLQANSISQVQAAFNDASAGNAKGDGNVVAGNNAFALSFQDQDADASNDNDDNDDFNSTQVDICDTVLLAFTC